MSKGLEIIMKVAVQDLPHIEEIKRLIESTGGEIIQTAVLDVREEDGKISGTVTEQKATGKEYDPRVLYAHDQPEMVQLMPVLEELASYCDSLVEIGCGHGNGSTRSFERGLKRSITTGCARHYMVDIDPDRPHIKPEVIHGSYHPSYYCLDSSKERMPADISWFLADLLYIDTEHTYEHLNKELDLWFALENEYMLYVFHDTWMFGQYNPMTDAIKERAHSGWTYLDWTKESHGLGMLVHSRSNWPKQLVEVAKKFNHTPEGLFLSNK